MRRRSLGAAVVALVAATVAPAFVAPPAQAASYRYWSYWGVEGGSWSWAQVGPRDVTVRDRQVQGWRFAITTDSRSATGPRQSAATAFDEVCARTPQADGKARVALIVDFGLQAHARPGDATPADPLRGTCEVVDTGSTGWDVLVSAGYAVRTDRSSMICALAGYPSKGCGESVADPPKTQEPRPAGGSGSGSGGGAGSGSDPDRTSRPKKDRDGATKGGAPAATTSTPARATGDASPGASRTASADAAASPSASTSTSPAPTSTDAPAAEPSPTLVNAVPEAPTSDGGGPGGLVGLLLGLAVLGGLGGAALVRSRRSA